VLGANRFEIVRGLYAIQLEMHVLKIGRRLDEHGWIHRKRWRNVALDEDLGYSGLACQRFHNAIEHVLRARGARNIYLDLLDYCL
jgi:hypothetical protein